MTSIGEIDFGIKIKPVEIEVAEVLEKISAWSSGFPAKKIRDTQGRVFEIQAIDLPLIQDLKRIKKGTVLVFQFEPKITGVKIK